ncbi:Spy0128 family protein, partial [Facklamia hominis]
MKIKKMGRWLLATVILAGSSGASSLEPGQVITEVTQPFGISRVYASDASDELSSWGDLVKKVSESTEGSEVTLTVGSQGIDGSQASDKLVVRKGQTLHLVGTGTLKGKGLDSIVVEEGGTLTIDGPTVSNAQVQVKGQLNIVNGGIKDTKLPGSIISVEGGSLHLSGGEISSNEAQALTDSDNTEYSVVTIKKGSMVMDGGRVSQNKSLQFGGAISSWDKDSTITINDGEISNNQAIHPTRYAYGGAIYTRGGTISMNKGMVKANSAERGGAVAIDNGIFQMKDGSFEDNSNGEYSGQGGALYALSQSKLTIDGGQFNHNKANGAGGALYIADSYTKINGGSYTNNESSKSGGALALIKSKDAAEDVGITEIHAGEFKGNEATGFWGGGAIYNDTFSTLRMYNTLIKDNRVEKPFLIGIGVGGKSKPASMQGGGVWNCPTGQTITHIDKGVAIYDNEAGNANQGKYLGAGDDFVNIQKDIKNPGLEITSRLLGGGHRLWYKDGSIQNIHVNYEVGQQDPRFDPNNPGEPLEYNKVMEGHLGYKSVPSEDSKFLAERLAKVFIMGNKASHLGISGGGITNNGKLIFGQEGSFQLKLVKKWVDQDGNSLDSNQLPEGVNIPYQITIKVLINGRQTDTVVLKKSEGWTATIDDFPNPEYLENSEISFVEEEVPGFKLEVREANLTEASLEYELVNKIKSADYTPVVSKVLTGRELKDNEFTFQLLQDGQVIDTVTNTASGQVSFRTLKYTKPGTYNYQIKEVKPEELTELGLTYDERIYTLTVEVTDNLDLQATYKVDNEAADQATFENKFEPVKANFVPQAMKTLSGRELKEGEFTFQLLEDDKVIDTATNTAAGQVTFKEIEYSQPGTYHYTIRERSGREIGMSYDQSVYQLTVTVDDKMELTAIYSKEGQTVEEPNFVNTVGDSPKGLVTLYKVDADTNAALKGAQFKLVQDKAAIPFYLDDPTGQVQSVSGIQVIGSESQTVDPILNDGQIAFDESKRTKVYLGAGSYQLDLTNAKVEPTIEESKDFELIAHYLKDEAGNVSGIMIEVKITDSKETSEETTSSSTDSTTTTTTSVEVDSETNAELVQIEQEIKELEAQMEAAKQVQPIIEQRLVSTTSQEPASEPVGEMETNGDGQAASPAYEEVVVNQDELDQSRARVKELEAQISELKIQLAQLQAASTTSTTRVTTVTSSETSVTSVEDESTIETSVEQSNLSSSFNVTLMEPVIRTTGDQGEIIFDRLPLGIYHFEEVQAPSGYQMNDQPIPPFEIMLAANQGVGVKYKPVDPITVKNAKVPEETTTETTVTTESTSTTESTTTSESTSTTESTTT